MIERLLFNLLTTLLTPLAFTQSISSNSPLCTDNSLTLELKASGGSTYAWSGPNNFTSNQQNPIISKATASNAGTYTCSVDGKTSLTVGVKVGKLNSTFGISWGTNNAQLIINASGSNINLSSINTLKYSWTGPNNFNSTLRENSINGFDKSNSGVYKLTVTDEFGCVSSTSTSISVADCAYSPNITVITSNNSTSSWSGTGQVYPISICEGSLAVFRIDTTYWGRNVKIQWFKNDKLIDNAVGLEYKSTEPAIYYAQISKGSCSYITSKMRLQAQNIKPLMILYQSNGVGATDRTICDKGGYTDLNWTYPSTFIREGITSAQWYKDGVAIPNLNPTTINSFKATQAGSYQVKVINGKCEAISDPFVVKVSDKIKTSFGINTAGYYSTENQKVFKFCSENNNNLTIEAYGDGEKKIYKNSNVVFKESWIYVYYNASQQPGTYVLETKQGQCTSLDTLTLEYGKSTQVPLFKYTDISCFNPSRTNYYLFNINPYSGIKWYKDGSLFSSGNALTISASGQYQGIFENTTTGCKGETEKINFTMPTVANRQIFQITYSLGKKVAICKNSKEARRLTINNSYSQGVWKRDGIIHDAGNSSSQTFISQAGKYWYEYNSGQCVFYSDTLEAFEEELPKITLTQSCLKDNNIKLSINSMSNVKYNWFQNGVVFNTKDTIVTTSQTGKYVVETSRNGCFVSSNEVNIGVSAPEAITICNGDSLKLKASSDVSTTFSWTGPNNFKSTLQNPIITRTNKNNQGLYKISVTDKSGCTFVAQTKVLMDDYPAFTLPKTITACAGSDFLFNQLVSKPLTDSTETVSSYIVVAPNKNTYNGNFSLNNVASKDAGIYNFLIGTTEGQCRIKTTMELIVDASENCKSISIASNISKNICAEQTFEIPFKTTGVFKTGTVFKAYVEEGYLTADDQNKIRKVVLGTGTKSPIKVNGFNSGRGYNIKVESEDGIVSIGNQYVYTNSVNSNYIIDANGYGLNSECSSLPLTLSYGNTYTNQQWFLNGDTLKKEIGRTITATKSGKYSFVGTELSGCRASFSKDVIIGKLDKPQLYRDKLNELSCFNESAYLSIPQYTNAKYTWRRNGILQTETNSFIDATEAGKYTVEISKETCKTTSDTVEVKLNPNKNINLSASSYQSTDKNKEIQTIISAYGLGNATYKYQLFKDNQLFAEGSQNQTIIKDVGKYFFKVTKGDCEAVSNVVDYKGVNGIINNAEKRNLYFNGGYDYLTQTVQLCDTNTIQLFYGYPYDYQSNTVANRKVTAYRNDKILPIYKESSSNYPYLRFKPNDYNFYLYFRGEGTYYVTEEVTLKDSTKLKFRYSDITVQISKTISLGSKIPQNVFFCADSTRLSGNTYSPNQRPISYSWKKDGVVVKKVTNPNESSSLIVKQSGSYVLETAYKGGCVANATPLKVELSKMNLLISDVSSLEICDGVPFTFNPYISGIQSNDTTKIVYQLLKDGKEQSRGLAANDKDFIYSPLSIKEAGTYTLKAQKGKCQGVSNDLVIKTIKVPNNINYADSVLFCQTSSVNLKTTEDASLSYLWEREGGFIKDAIKATLEVKEAGIYRSLNRNGDCWNYTPKVRAKVLANILPTAILNGDKEINYADTAKVSIAFTSHAPWMFKLSDGKEYTATKSPFEVSLKPQFSTNYTLTEVKNVCGIGTIAGTANIKVLILSSELEEGINLNVFPVPSEEDVNIQLVLDKPEAMEWTLNNVNGSVLGSEVQANKSTRHESNVSLKSLPEGVYFLRIQVGEKSLIRKIIKSN